MTSAIVMVNGTPFSGWLEIAINRSVEKGSGDTRLKISPQPGKPFPLKLGDKIKVLLNARGLINGHVHEVDGAHGWGEHFIQVTVRDKTQDLIDSTIGPGIEIKPPITLGDAARQIIGHMGLDVDVIEKVTTEPFKDGEAPVHSVDDKGFSFLEQWARKRQAILTTDGDGNLVIWRNEGERSGGSLHRGPPDDAKNNVIRATYKATDFNQANLTAVSAQKSANDQPYWEGLNKGTPLGDALAMSNKYGTANDTSIRPERRKHIRASKGVDGATPDDSAAWESNVARARAMEYTAEVAGHGPTSTSLWMPGMVVPVSDYFFDLEDELLIKEIGFHVTWGGGGTTQLRLCDADSFKKAADGSKRKGRGGKPGAGRLLSGSFKSTNISKVK
jgi:prophage tail gpP-like protein